MAKFATKKLRRVVNDFFQRRIHMLSTEKLPKSFFIKRFKNVVTIFKLIFGDQTLNLFYRHNSGFFKIKFDVTDFGKYFWVFFRKTWKVL